MNINTHATEYEVCALPEDNINHSAYVLKVARRGAGRWAILHHGMCLGVDGEWDYELRPSEREDDWLATHRFDLTTALRLAEEQAPLVEVNGFTVADALARTARRRG